LAANGFDSDLVLRSNDLKVTSTLGSLALSAESPLNGRIHIDNSFVALTATAGQSWLAQNSQGVAGQATIFIGAVEANSRARVSGVFGLGARIQGGKSVEITTNSVLGGALSINAGSTLEVVQTGLASSKTPGIEFITAYGDISVEGGQMYVTSPTNIVLNGFDSITFGDPLTTSGLTANLRGGGSWLNARQGDLIIDTSNSIVVQSTTLRLSTTFQESDNKLTMSSATVVIDMIDLLAILSDVSLVSQNGDVQFLNDAYVYSLMSLPIIATEENIRGATCPIAGSVVISIALGLQPRICACYGTPLTWKCTANNP